MKMADFKVNVLRYSEGPGIRSCCGSFVSKVYAIDKTNDFLVYDPGEAELPAMWCFVNPFKLAVIDEKNGIFTPVVTPIDDD